MGFVWRVKVASRRESPCLSQHPRLCGWRVCRVRALPVHRRVCLRVHQGLGLL